MMIIKKNNSLHKRRLEIINLSKKLISKNGWNELLFKQISLKKKINYKELNVLFPNGYKDMIKYFFISYNKEIENKFHNYNFTRTPIHKKIKKILIVSLIIASDDKVFFKRTINYLLIPGNYTLLIKVLYKLSNNIWNISGDISTDFNFYTKRTILSGIYISTILRHFQTDNMLETEKYLDDLLLKVSKIPKIKNRIGLIKRNIPNLFNFIKNYSI